MQVHGACSHAEVAMTTEETFQGLDQGAVVARIMGQQRTQRLLIEFVQFVLPVQVEEQTIDTQSCERMDFSFTKEPPPNFQSLLSFSIGLWHSLQACTKPPY